MSTRFATLPWAAPDKVRPGAVGVVEGVEVIRRGGAAQVAEVARDDVHQRCPGRPLHMGVDPVKALHCKAVSVC